MHISIASSISLLALLLAGCVRDAYVIHPDPGVAPSVLDAAQAAVEAWTAHVPVTIRLDGAPCGVVPAAGDVCLHPIAAIPSLPWEPGTLAGVTAFNEIWIAEPLLERASPAQRQRLIAHELGHAMGLLHTGPGTLMYPYASGGAMTVTPADVAQWYAVRGRK
jgi:hypothetical protein